MILVPLHHLNSKWKQKRLNKREPQVFFKDAYTLRSKWSQCKPETFFECENPAWIRMGFFVVSCRIGRKPMKKKFWTRFSYPENLMSWKKKREYYSLTKYYSICTYLSRNQSIKAVTINAAKIANQTSTLKTSMNLNKDLARTGSRIMIEIPDWSKYGATKSTTSSRSLVIVIPATAMSISPLTKSPMTPDHVPSGFLLPYPSL